MSFSLARTTAKSLVIIGPPDVETLQALLSDGPSQAVLIEPETERARSLKQEFEEQKKVLVLTGAIGAPGQKAEFVEYNFPGLRSLRKPSTALRELFPGLSARETSVLELHSIEDLLAQTQPLAEPIALRIDLPGSELDILVSMENSGLLKQVCQISIRCSAEPMFEGGPGIQDVERWLQNQFFQVTDQDRRDPDWPVLQLEANPLAQELADVKARLSDTQTTLSACQNDLQKAQERSLQTDEKAQQDLLTVQNQKQRIATLEEELAEERQALAESHQDRNSRLAALQDAQERCIRLPELETALKKTTDEATAAQQEAATANQKLSENLQLLTMATDDTKALAAQLASVQETVKASEKRLQTEVARASQLETDNKGLAARIDSLIDTAKRRTEELERVQAGVAAASQREQNLQQKLTDTQSALETAEEQLRKIDATSSEPAVAPSDQIQLLEQKVEALSHPQESNTETSAQVALDGDKKALESKNKELDAAKAKIDSLQSDLAIALRMQQKAQADIRELRGRYQETEQVRKTQSTLLQKLTPRLQQAAQQLQTLSLNGDVAPTLKIEASDTAAPKTRTTRTRKSSSKAKAKTSTSKRSPTTKKSEAGSQ